MEGRFKLVMMGKLYNFFTKLLLVIFSIFFVLVLFEIILRFIRPEYQYSAGAKVVLNQFRIRENPRNTKYYRIRPDSNKKHLVIHNSLGFRQHREFTKKKPKDVIRIGFFGDSYTENLRIESQYSFTEPLDYLLNKTGKKYEIMNFGVDGYGTDQIFFQYLQNGVGLDLDIVFYIYCNNDLGDIRANNLLKVDQNGNIKATLYKRKKIMHFLSKFYLTYLIIDSNACLRNELLENRRKKKSLVLQCKAIENNLAKGVITDDADETLRIYFTILAQIERICKKNHAKFYIVTLPFISTHNMAKLLVKKGFKVIDLYDKFTNIYKKKEYSFETTRHWNEEGNKLAAIFLFKFLAKELDINYSDDNFIEQSLYEYYSSFEPYRVTSLFVKKHHNFPATLNNNIKSRYLFLEKLN